MPLPSTGIAVFDFDDTLIAGDSLPRFLYEVAGLTRTRLAMAGAVAGALAGHGLGRPAGVDLPGSVKALLLRATLQDLPIAAAHDGARRLRARLRWLTPQLDALHRHAAAGHRIVVASGALDVYLPILLEGLPVHDILATDMDIRDGRLTGHLTAGNCVRALKAARVRPLLDAWPGPSWGYGNRPSDLPMLALVDHPTLV
ncbi:MAG: haloacid dehalogenase-like hydrolase [Rhodospirillaceae bacterium]